MKIGYTFSLALSNLSHSGLRTWLTIIGIVIGVAAVVLIVSIGNGLQANVQSQLGGLGADVITVSPGFSRATGGFGFRGGGGGEGSVQSNLTIKDLHTISLTQNVKEAMGILSSRESVSFGDSNATAQVKGIDPLLFNDFTADVVGSGRGLTPSDSHVIVIGYNLANGYFSRPVTPNSILTIGGSPYRVVGILAQGGGFGSDDNTVLMSLQDARNLFTGFQHDQFTSIMLKASDPSLVDQVTASVTQNLFYSRHVTSKNQDITVTAAQSIRAQISSVTSSISLFLGAIAAISLLVGAIGIANTMFMTVLERTKQIGVFKALGATRSEIERLFIFEAGILGFTGGLIGIILSLLLSSLVSATGIGISLPAPGARGGGGILLITPELVVFALIFSTIIGIVSGYFPARQAASLRPVEALKYE